MTSSKHILAMIRSHAAGDQTRLLAIADQIAEEAEKAGRTRVAGDIKQVVARVRLESEARRSQPVPAASPRGELAGLLAMSRPEIRLTDLVLHEDLSKRLLRIVREHRERDVLSERGLSPRRKLLLSGPPGTGKSMTASALAAELSLPLFTMLLDGVITKFMGETAAKLRLIFEAMKTTPGVYFFDEVDALAGSRGFGNDIGEARRMLNSFLVLLEGDVSSSVVVAATNHSTLLDPALFRRFDAHLAYAKPTREEARNVLLRHLSGFDLAALPWQEVDDAAAELSQADLAAAARDAARDSVLDHGGTITPAGLVASLKGKAGSGCA